MKIFQLIGRVFLISLFSLLALSCNKDDVNPSDYNNLENLPVDTGGVQSIHYLDTSLTTFGYYLYKPSGYEANTAEYPLLVFLHGSGEKGNSMNDTTVLTKVLRNGPPKLINKKQWNPTYPMLVASPQCHDGWWNAQKVHDFISEIIEQNRVNEDRIYLTGLSMGGFGTWSYIQTYADTGHVVAIVPICGGGNKNKVEGFLNMPVWAFHGDNDNTVSKQKSIDMVDAINALDPPAMYKAKLTMYPGVAHNSWSRTYDGTGMGQERTDYNAFDQSIYDWFFQYRKMN